MPRRQQSTRRNKQPVDKALKGFADARKSSNDLLRDIRSHVVAEGIKHEGTRESHKIHVSELVKDACPRMLHYKITETPTTDPIPPAGHRLEMIWAAGSQEHLKWQKWLQDMGVLWGAWYCLQCQNKWDDTSPEACKKCGGVLLRYGEVELEVGTLVGHADGAVPEHSTLVEVKSFSAGTVRVEDARRVAEHTYKVEGKSLIDHDGLWKSVVRPLRSHLVQGMMYLWMCRQRGLGYDRITFIYENKTNQDTKTFEVKYSERYIKPYLKILEEVEASAAEGVVPRRPPLFTRESKPCSACPFRTFCWTGETSDNTEESPAVPAGGSGSGGEEAGREAKVRLARPAPRAPAEGSGRHHRLGRRGPDRADDAADSVGRTPGRATGDGRGGREVGRGRDGEGAGRRLARRKR